MHAKQKTKMKHNMLTVDFDNPEMAGETNYNNIYIDSTHKSRHKLITEEKDSDPDSYKRDSRKASINNIPRYFYMEEIMKFLGATPSLGWESERYYDNILGLAPGTNSSHDVYEMCVPTCWPRHILSYSTRTTSRTENEILRWKISHGKPKKQIVSIDYFIRSHANKQCPIDVSTILTDKQETFWIVNGVIDLVILTFLKFAWILCRRRW